MNKITKLFIIAIAAFSFVACGGNQTNGTNDKIDNTITEGPHRGGAMYSLGNQQVQVSQIIEISNKRMEKDQASADEETVNAISDNLVAAESKQALSVKFSADDAPVENGMFIFSIESEDEGSKEMIFQVFDEEEFELSANNVITVNQGENYKALNVGGLDNGSYTFRLKDGAGGEKDHAIVVQNK